MSHIFPWEFGDSDAKLGGGFGLDHGGPASTNPFPDNSHSLDSVGPFEATQNDEGSKYSDGWPANYSINRALAIKMGDNIAQAKLETAKGIPTFIRDMKVQTLDMLSLTQVRGLPLFNFMCKTEHYRKTYGRQFSCKALFELWKLFGVPTHDLVAKSEAGVDSRVTTTTAGKILMPDWWLAEGRKSQTGDHLFLVVRKYVFVDEAKKILDDAAEMDDIEEFDQGRNKSGFRFDENVEDEFSMITPGMRRANNDMRTTSLVEFQDMEQEAEDCYWQVDLFSSSTGEKPPIETYHNEFFEGCCWHYGRVGHLYGVVTEMDEAMMNAQAALYPKANDATYLQAMNLLPNIEVFVAMQ